MSPIAPARAVPLRKHGVFLHDERGATRSAMVPPLLTEPRTSPNIAEHRRIPSWPPSRSAAPGDRHLFALTIRHSRYRMNHRRSGISTRRKAATVIAAIVLVGLLNPSSAWAQTPAELKVAVDTVWVLLTAGLVFFMNLGF